MDDTRRVTLLSLLTASALLGFRQDSNQAPGTIPPASGDKEKDDGRMPDGKSRDDAIAKHEHEGALKDADQLLALAQQIHDEVVKAGNYVVPVETLKKTEEIEKLARKIRSRLKG